MNKYKSQEAQALSKSGGMCNHLGSTAFVTDGNATVTQGFLYAPFGEITTEYAPMWQNGVLPNYTFNAKELDEESGMYYYEARYYAPPVFVSRDPHFERYFWTSPYGYCSNNPLNRVDPTGMDEWEIDGSGNVVNHTKTTEHDAFYMVDKDGNRINGKSCEFEYGVVESFHSQYSDKNQSQFDWYNVRGDEQGKQLFEFFANNTNVEWGQLQLGQKGNHGLNVITTSHNKSRESCGSWLIGNKYQYGYTIRKHIHNHPGNTAYPSGLQKGNKDIGFAKRISKISSNISLQIYLPQSGKYINYNALSQPEDFPAFPCPTYTLKGVTVKAHK